MAQWMLSGQKQTKKQNHHPKCYFSSRVTFCTAIYLPNLISMTEECDKKMDEVFPFHTLKAYGGVEIELSPS
jgi:hypothetical protein